MIITAIVAKAVASHGKHVLKLRDSDDPATEDWNDAVEVVCFHNLAFGTNVKKALREMEAVASGSRCEKFLYLAALNPDRAGGRELTDDEAEQSAQMLLDLLGFGRDHQWLLVRHRKKQRVHYHVIANRVCPESLKAVHLGWNYIKQECAARTMEMILGLPAVSGAFAGRPADANGHFTEPRPPRRRRKQREEQQAVRTKVPIEQVNADLARAWAQAISGADWQRLLEERGYRLARGEKRDFVVVDLAGGVHSPARRLQIKVADLRQRTSDLVTADLPTVGSIRSSLRKGSEPAAPEAFAADNPPERTASQPGIEP